VLLALQDVKFTLSILTLALRTVVSPTLADAEPAKLRDEL